MRAHCRFVRREVSGALREAVAEDEAATESAADTVMKVPKPLVPPVRELIAKHQRDAGGGPSLTDRRHAARSLSNPNVIAVHSPHIAPRATKEGREFRGLSL